MADTFRVVTPDFVNLVITSSAEEYACTVERRFPKSLTIAELKVCFEDEVRMSLKV